ncbi:Uncharacterised protein [Vibrio cholerae]|nr:Uncharacterised protein [Vibrio cholerae]
MRSRDYRGCLCDESANRAWRSIIHINFLDTPNCFYLKRR